MLLHMFSPFLAFRLSRIGNLFGKSIYDANSCILQELTTYITSFTSIAEFEQEINTKKGQK